MINTFFPYFQILLKLMSSKDAGIHRNLLLSQAVSNNIMNLLLSQAVSINIMNLLLSRAVSINIMNLSLSQAVSNQHHEPLIISGGEYQHYVSPIVIFSSLGQLSEELLSYP